MDDFVEVRLDDTGPDTWDRMRALRPRRRRILGVLGKGWNDLNDGPWPGKWKTRSYLVTDRGMLRIRRGPLGWLRRRRARRLTSTPLCGPARYTARRDDAD